MHTVTEERIRQRAYELWQLEGCLSGRDRDHWFQAASELSHTPPAREAGRPARKSRAKAAAGAPATGPGATKAKTKTPRARKAPAEAGAATPG